MANREVPVTISQCIRWLQEIKLENGDIDVLLPDGRPLRKIDVIQPTNKQAPSEDDIQIQLIHDANNGLRT